MEQLLLEKPFTDPEERYTVTNSKEQNCFKVHNLESGKTYIVNPFAGFCDCQDFEYRTNGGTCKHIEFLQNNDRIKPLIEKYNSDSGRVNQTVSNPRVHGHVHENKTGLTPVVPEIVGQMPYSLMERKDEDQILEELKGNVIKEYIYDFDQNGRRVTGLSYAGVTHVALRMGHIHTGEPIIQEMNGGFIAKTQATDMKRNLSMWGVAFQSKTLQFRDGGKIEDQFAITKVVAKSTRNALRKLFDEKIVIEMINQYRKQHNNGRRDAK
jgi:hypothetical protein